MKRPNNNCIIKGHGTFIKDIGIYNNSLLNYLINKNEFNKKQLINIKEKINTYLERIQETIQSLEIEDNDKSK